MSERPGAATFQGNALTLAGDALEAGASLPEVSPINDDLSPVALSSYRGKVCVVCTVPSLDTPVCDTEARRFNEEADRLGDDVQVVVISMDLPFAQARWCGAAGIEHVSTLSAHRDAGIGEAFGVLIKELRLLSRAVFVADRAGVVRYVEYVKEITEQPDYESALSAIEKARS